MVDFHIVAPPERDDDDSGAAVLLFPSLTTPDVETESNPDVLSVGQRQGFPA